MPRRLLQRSGERGHGLSTERQAYIGVPTSSRGRPRSRPLHASTRSPSVSAGSSTRPVLGLSRHFEKPRRSFGPATGTRAFLPGAFRPIHPLLEISLPRRALRNHVEPISAWCQATHTPNIRRRTVFSTRHLLGKRPAPFRDETSSPPAGD